MLINFVLWLAGLALLVLGVMQGRGPYTRLRGLRAADENARRYDGWRGVRRGADDGGITGAGEMREQLSTRLRLWAGVAIAGIVLIAAGFVIR